MPIYEYTCENCGAAFDVMQRISDAPLKDCEACGKPALKRLVSAAGFRLQGGGWYETDFKGGDKKRNLADKPDSTDKSSEASATAASKTTSTSTSSSSNTSSSTKDD